MSDALAGYERYQAPNWDGYDASPISLETVDAARCMIGSLPPEWRPPDLAPGADGSIGLEWWIPSKKLFIDVGPGRTWSAYWRWSGGRGHLERREVKPWSVEDLLERLPVEIVHELAGEWP